MSAMSSSVLCAKKLTRQKSRPRPCPPSRRAFPPSNARTSATWSLRVSAASARLAASAWCFLSSGSTNGSLYAIPAAMVNAGLRHPNAAATTNIFPTRGSTGSAARCSPSGASRSSASSAPTSVNSASAFRTLRSSGGSSALATNAAAEPRPRTLSSGTVPPAACAGAPARRGPPWRRIARGCTRDNTRRVGFGPRDLFADAPTLSKSTTETDTPCC